MNNLDELINRIKILSEIELESLMKEIADHLSKNKMEHILNNVFEMDKDDIIADLQEEVDDLKIEIKELSVYKRQIREIQDII